jgi:predicted amidophosphoribosyltransferase
MPIRQLRWAERRRLEGRCARCGKPRDTDRSSWYCRECLAKNQRYMLVHNKRQRYMISALWQRHPEIAQELWREACAEVRD